MAPNNTGDASFSLVVTNYRCWDMTVKCVNAHLKLENLEEIIIVDDCSGEIIPEFHDSRVKIIQNPVNLGFVKSVNVGIRNASQPIVILFDADAYPLVEYKRIVSERFSADPELAMLGFHTYDENGVQTASFESEPGIWSLILGQKWYFYFHKPNIATVDNMIVYSCAVALRRDAFLQNGGLDEQIDWIDPDVEKCIDLRKAGWKIDVDERLKAFHKGGGIPQLTSKRVIKQYTSRWYVLSKHGKIRNKAISRFFIMMRLQLEYQALKLISGMLYPVHIAADKVSGRKELITICRKTFI